MKKEETIKKYGLAAYEKHLQQRMVWYTQHREEEKGTHKVWCEGHREEVHAIDAKWREANPDKKKESNQKWAAANQGKVKAISQEQSRKGGKYYRKQLEYQHTGLQGERNRIRCKHWGIYRGISQATPNSQIHHEWIPGTAKYRGVALVDKEAHQNGIIKVIKLLEGEITLFTEERLKEKK